MSGKTVNSAILLLVIGNAMAIISDVFIKLMEPGAHMHLAGLLCMVVALANLPLAINTDAAQGRRPEALIRMLSG